MRPSASSLLCTLIFATSLGSLTAQTPVTAAPTTHPAYEADPKFVAALAEAKQMAQQRRYDFALDAYQKANKIAKGACASCVQESYDLQIGLHHFKDAASSASQLIALALNPQDKSLAEYDLGEAILRQAGDKPKPDQMDAAHTAFRSALSDFPRNNPARFRDACLLARMGKTDEAREQFTACAEAAGPSDPMRSRARHFAENPALSLSKMAPAFAVTALDGTRFNLDDMGGRVVLIDFWATWCGPCNVELPHLQKIAKEFAGQPLVIISISWDSDEAKWKDFVGKHEMTWSQYRDADHSLSDRFGVTSIPHYFTIDSDGVLTGAMLGAEEDVEGKLKKLIKRANETKPSVAAKPLVAELGVRASSTH